MAGNGHDTLIHAKLEGVLKKKCRSCGSKNLVPILSLGYQYISDFCDIADQEKDSIPLELVLCEPKNEGCGLLQLNHTTPQDRLYRHYWYRSGINQTMKNALKEITNSIQTLVPLKSNDIVIDIGSNDSTLLRSYTISGLKLVGFEPAKNLMEYAKIDNGRIINNYFSFDSFKKFFGNEKAKAITSISMFYDLDDPNIFVRDIKKCLHDNGIWIIQMNYLVSMLIRNAFDNIGHEHLEYYSLLSLENLLKRNDMEVFDVELNDINGGSFRIYVKHKDAIIKSLSESEKRLTEIRKKEFSMGLDNIKVYKKFAQRIEKLKEKTLKFIKEEAAKRKTIYLYGASTRGNTLLQYYGLDNTILKAAADRNPDKWGKYIVGTSIPIISEKQARGEKPNYFLVLPWHFIKEFQDREIEFLKKGGKFIVPLPHLRIIEYRNEETITLDINN